MARDRLALLQTVRNRAVEAARRQVAECMAAEAVAVKSLAALQDQANRDAATVWAEAYLYQDMIPVRLAALQIKRGQAIAAHKAATERTELARGEAVAARTAAEAVDTLVDERTLAARTEADRRAQHSLDDMVRRR